MAGRAALRRRGQPRRAFRALADVDGDVHKAIEQADPEVRDLLDGSAWPMSTPTRRWSCATSSGAAARRELRCCEAERDLGRNAGAGCDAAALEHLDDPEAGWDAAGQLLRWLTERREAEESG